MPRRYYDWILNPQRENSDDTRNWQAQNGQTRNKSGRGRVSGHRGSGASTHGYLVAWNIPGNILEGLAAIVLWPLVALFGVDLHTLIA